MNQALPPMSTARFIGRVIVGVLIAEALWGLIVSLTRNLLVPYLTQVMGGTPQASQPVINVPDIFSMVMALCLAGIIAVILNAMLNRPDRSTRVVSVTTVPASTPISKPQPLASVASPPIAKPTSPAPAATVTTVPVAAPVPASKPSQPAVLSSPTIAAMPSSTAAPAAPVAAKLAPAVPPAPPPKPAKPKTPKEIQYNIVGEPISPMDEDE